MILYPVGSKMEMNFIPLIDIQARKDGVPENVINQEKLPNSVNQGKPPELVLISVASH